MGKGKRTRKIIGTSERPRLSVYRSLKHMHVQIVDDLKGRTLASLSTLKNKKKGGNIQAAKILGTEAAKLAQSKGIKKIVFDRGNFIYHGRVEALAKAMREGGLEF